jgi:hypothetical protein
MLCQAQAMPSISSYSASPVCHSRKKKPLRRQRWKCAWIALPLPKLAGSAFHWQPVRST